MSKFLRAPTTPSIDMEARGFRRSKSTEVVTPGFPKMHRRMISSCIQFYPLRYTVRNCKNRINCPKLPSLLLALASLHTCRIHSEEFWQCIPDSNNIVNM